MTFSPYSLPLVGRSSVIGKSQRFGSLMWQRRDGEREGGETIPRLRDKRVTGAMRAEHGCYVPIVLCNLDKPYNAHSVLAIDHTSRGCAGILVAIAGSQFIRASPPGQQLPRKRQGKRAYWKKSVHISRSPLFRCMHLMLLCAASWHGSKYSLYCLLGRKVSVDNGNRGD